MKKPIYTENAPAPIGPYSQAIWANDFLFISGQVAIDPENQEIIRGGIEQETHRVMKNIEAILKEAGLSFDEIVNSTLYLINFDDFSVINSIYESYLSIPFPARTTIEVSKLPKGLNLEIAVVAHKK